MQAGAAMALKRAHKVYIGVAFLLGVAFTLLFSLNVTKANKMGVTADQETMAILKTRAKGQHEERERSRMGMCFCEYFEYTMIPTENYKEIMDATKEECCKYCIEDKKCFSWTLTADGVCGLKETTREEVDHHIKHTGEASWSGIKCLPHPVLTGGAEPAPSDSIAAAEVGEVGGQQQVATLEEITSKPKAKAKGNNFLTAPNIEKAAGPKEPASQEEHMAHLETLTTAEERQSAVRGAIHHAWTGYSSVCFGQDDLRPISKSCDNWLGAQGNTLIDSMSTLYLSGLHDEFTRAQGWVQDSMDFDKVRGSVSHFETVIRVLGGLLSAHDLSGEQIFVEKATDLADRMKSVFSTASGLPKHSVTPSTGGSSGDGNSLADIGTLTMEYFKLSELTGDMGHRKRAHKVTEVIAKTNGNSGMYGNHWSANSGSGYGTISFDGEGDSFYEYLLKVWLLTGRKHDMYKDMYVRSIEGMMQKLVRKTGDYTYLSQIPDSNVMGHLACFVPGMLAMGAKSGIVNAEKSEEHLQLAKDLVHSCYSAYEKMETGIGPDSARFSGGDIRPNDARYLNRPETSESVFYLWKATKDPMYREWGWKIFKALERHCRVETGYAGLNNVNSANGGGKIDKMESFFVAETLKYLYLIQSDDDVLPMSGIDDAQGKTEGNFFVFNTEAHPLKSWDDQQPL